MSKKFDNSIIFDSITQLQEGNYDTPIDTSVSKEWKNILGSLEELRIRSRELREESADKIKSIDNTIASVAHDLKTPIAVILGYAECLQEGIDDKDYPSLIIKKAEEMNEQVLSIVEANRNKPIQDHFEKLSVRNFFYTEFEKFRSVVEGKGLKFNLRRIPDIELYGDKRSLSAMVLNLMSNAIKYTENGKITVSFTKKKDCLRIRVKDSGVGIEKSDLPRIFDKFYMGDKARTDLKSSGLGLFTVKETISRHGGKIDVKSKVGNGSVFEVYLPLEKKDRGNTFDSKSRLAKLIVFILTYPFNPSFVYRIAKAKKREDQKGMWVAILTLPICYIVWIYDLVTLLVENKIDY